MSHTENSNLEKRQQLTKYFGESTGLNVLDEWKMELQAYRFYFEIEDTSAWKYILDMSQSDFDRSDVDDTIKALEAAKWRQHLESSGDKKIHVFTHGKFSGVREWPDKQ